MNKNVRATAKRVLAIGTTNAALSPEDALSPDGLLILMERDPERAERARQRFLSLGLAQRASVIVGEPRRMLYKLAGPFDVIFCEDEDSDLLDKLATLLAPDGTLITKSRERPPSPRLRRATPKRSDGGRGAQGPRK
jgi:predicted O-methyltransferase YrrM